MYNPLLRITRTWILEKSFGEKKYFGCINRVYKVGFFLGFKKNLEKMKNCLLLSEHMEFLSAGTFYFIIFVFAIMHPDVPGLLAVPLINRFNQSSEIYIYIA